MEWVGDSDRRVATIKQTLVHFRSVAVQILTLHLFDFTPQQYQHSFNGSRLAAHDVVYDVNTDIQPKLLEDLPVNIIDIKCTFFLFSNCSQICYLKLQ